MTTPSGLSRNPEYEAAHVVPRGDYVHHEMTEDCVCGPRVQAVDNGATLVVHHALDGREKA